jgi:hypothetical protein
MQRGGSNAQQVSNDHATDTRESLFFTEDHVMRAGLCMMFAVLVITDHEVALAVDRFGFPFAVDDLHVDAGEPIVGFPAMPEAVYLM